MSTVRPTRGNGADRDEQTPAARARLPATTRAAVPGVVGEAGGAGLSAACRVSDALAGHLAALGPDVEARREPDGRVTLTMPETWACLYLATIRAQAETFREKMHKADREVRVRAAEARALSGEPARQWEAEQAAIFAEYRRLVASGVAHREALHRLKAQGAGRFTVTDLEEVVRAQGSRERHQQRQARAERVRGLAAEGATPEQIGEREDLTVDQVKACLRRGRVPLAPFGPRVAQRERRDAILALHRQGMMPREIVERTGLAWSAVMYAIKGTPRGTARARASAGG